MSIGKQKRGRALSISLFQLSTGYLNSIVYLQSLMLYGIRVRRTKGVIPHFVDPVPKGEKSIPSLLLSGHGLDTPLPHPHCLPQSLNNREKSKP